MNSCAPSIRYDDRKEDKPQFSRIFVVCGKQLREEDLKPHFEKFGCIEHLFMPRDRNTGDTKGVAYIKYSKTSSAAAAIQEMHMKIIGNENKTIKVMIATSKSDHNTQINEYRYKRLFIKVHKEATEKEIREHFEEFGCVASIHLQKDKTTDENKGFAYVLYHTFLEAAQAFENCDRKYRPMFATPKDELKRNRNSKDLEHYLDNFNVNNSGFMRDSFSDYNHAKDAFKRDSLDHSVSANPQGYNTVSVTCIPHIALKYIERLFNIIPGMVNCQYIVDPYSGVRKAIITYNEETSAAHAVERINNFEFPSGEIVSVEPEKNPLSKAANDLTSIVNNFKSAIDNGGADLKRLAEVIAQASTLIKAATSGRIEPKEKDSNFCSVSLPPKQPLANIDATVAQRCFILCKPQPPPLATLRDVFCRFGDLIDVSTLPNKTFGFAKYASMRAAQEAIKTLNGVTLHGVRLKVLEANERPSKDDDKMVVDTDSNDYFTDHTDRKRMKVDDQDDVELNTQT